MKLLKDYIRKTLAHRHMGHQMVGAVALNTFKAFLAKQGATDNLKFGTLPTGRQVGNFPPSRTRKFENIQGYVRFKTMYIKTNDQALKIQIFRQKNQILDEVNLALSKVGYKTVVEEIRLKM